MQTNAKVQDRAISVFNHSSTITLKINKKQILSTLRKLAVLALFTTLGALLFTAFNSDSSQFWPLLKVTAILLMVAFIAKKSNNNFKNSN